MTTTNKPETFYLQSGTGADTLIKAFSAKLGKMYVYNIRFINGEWNMAKGQYMSIDKARNYWKELTTERFYHQVESF